MLTASNINQAKLLGEGSEAQVYALDDAYIVRLYRQGSTEKEVAKRTTLLAEIVAGARHLSFETPIVFEQGVLDGRIYTIEKRIAGTSLLHALSRLDGTPRRRLVAQYMDAAWALGSLKIERPFFGEIGRSDAIQTPTWQVYLVERANRSLATASLTNIDVIELADRLGKSAEAPAFVHLDYFAGNVMADGDQLTAVIDFGYSSIMGDRRMNAMIAAAYLRIPYITPVATSADWTTALAWLQTRDLFDYYEQGVPWLAAYWTFAHDDIGLYKWCCSVLTK